MVREEAPFDPNTVKVPEAVTTQAIYAGPPKPVESVYPERVVGQAEGIFLRAYQIIQDPDLDPFVHRTRIGEDRRIAKPPRFQEKISVRPKDLQREEDIVTIITSLYNGALIMENVSGSTLPDDLDEAGYLPSWSLTFNGNRQLLSVSIFRPDSEAQGELDGSGSSDPNVISRLLEHVKDRLSDVEGIGAAAQQIDLRDEQQTPQA